MRAAGRRWSLPRLLSAAAALLVALLLVDLARRGMARQTLEHARRAQLESRLEAAAGLFTRARWLEPERRSWHELELGLIELERGDLRRAELWLARAAPSELDRDGGHRHRLGSARLAAATGRAGEALELTERLLGELASTTGRAKGSHGGNAARRAELLILQAWVLHRLEGEAGEARRRLWQARRALAGLPPGSARPLLAKIHLERARLEQSYRRGRGELVEHHLGAATDLFEELGLRHLRQRAESLSLAGLIALSKDDYARHSDLQERALELFHRAGNLDGPARIEFYLGAMDVGLERHAEAGQRYGEARRRLEALGQTVALRSLVRLEADLELRLGRHRAARSQLEQLLPRLSSPAYRRRALFLLGHALMHGGEAAAAGERYAAALELDQSYGFEDPAFRARALAMIGVAATEAGRPELAGRAAHDALELAERHGDHPGRVVALLAVADLEAASEDPAAPGRSLDAIEQALDIQDMSYGAAASPFHFSQYWQSVERLRHLLLDLPTDAATHARAQGLLLRLLEQMRSRAFRASLFWAAARRRPPAAETAAIAELERRLARREDQLERAYRRYRRTVLETALDAAPEADAPPPPAGDWSAELASGEAAVVYAFGRRQAFALLIRRLGMRTVALPATPAELGDRVHLLVERLERTIAGESSDWRAPARRLYDDLITPLELGDIERLGIVPLGELHSLPWTALLDAAGRPLVERFTVASAPSLSALLRAAPAGRGEGAVAFGPGRGVEGPELPLAIEECRDVAQQVGGRALCGPRAKEAAFAAASGARLLHLAAHGVSEPAMPLLSRLALAPGLSDAGGADDGRLTVREILGRQLRSDLVVLSSCRTTASFAERAEDWTDADRLGLSGAFLQAGSRQVVSSLLPISDDRARALMSEFYRQLRRHPPAEALARAQRRRYLAGDVCALGFGVQGALH